jgi:hypothetical protein
MIMMVIYNDDDDIDDNDGDDYSDDDGDSGDSDLFFLANYY